MNCPATLLFVINTLFKAMSRGVCVLSANTASKHIFYIKPFKLTGRRGVWKRSLTETPLIFAGTPGRRRRWRWRRPSWKLQEEDEDDCGRVSSQRTSASVRRGTRAVQPTIGAPPRGWGQVPRQARVRWCSPPSEEITCNCWSRRQTGLSDFEWNDVAWNCATSQERRRDGTTSSQR